MGSSNPKRRTCKHCGRQMGQGEYVEIRILDWIPEKVMGYTRWKSKTMMTDCVCVFCAIDAVDRIEEGKRCLATSTG